jgi:hypothetical protein
MEKMWVGISIRIVAVVNAEMAEVAVGDATRDLGK